MDPITAGLVAGGIGLIGSSMTNQANTDIAQTASAFNAQQSQEQRDWQEKMRATQYQTTVDDLQKAGLNPMLAYQQGGAGIPSGAVATAAQAAPRQNVLGNAAQGALSASMNVADLKLKAEQVAATNAQTETTRTQGVNNLAQAVDALASAGLKPAQMQEIMKRLDLMSSQIESNKAGANLSSASAAKQKQETDLGIVSSNPVTQAWGEIKRGAQWVHGKFSPQLDLLTNSATKAMQNRVYKPAR